MKRIATATETTTNTIFHDESDSSFDEEWLVKMLVKDVLLSGVSVESKIEEFKE
jgi:hypothetical protein